MNSLTLVGERSKEDCVQKRIVAVLAAVLLLPLIGASQSSQTGVIADITFAFHAGKEVMPAGTYEFRPDTHGDVVTISNLKAKNSIMTSVLTRISPRPENQALVVFDKMGDVCYLSELHIPGVDGFHFTGAPGPHTHVTIRTKK
jgi:hypothetical protein